MMSARMSVFLRVIVVGVALWLCGAGQAAVNISGDIRGFSDNVEVTWVSLTINNPMSRPTQGEIVFMGWGSGGSRSGTRVKIAPIPPGQSRTVNIAVPIMDVYNGQFRESTGDEYPLNLESRNSSYNNKPLAFLYASGTAARLSEAEIDKFTLRVNPDTSMYSGISGMYSGMTGTATGTTRTLTPSERGVSQSLMEALPENWLCYTPLKYVVMAESDHGRLSAPQRQALDQWVALGGNLVLFDGGSSSTENLMRGTISRRNGNPITDVAFDPNINRPTFAIGEKLSNIRSPYRESKAGGRGGAFLLATLFLIVVGPVNYFYFARRGDIRKLIVSVPLISLGFCSLIAGYFIMTQGFNRKGGSISITTVDEESNRAVTFAGHSLLSGLYPFGGFHFSPETYFQARVDMEKSSAEFDLTRETVLKSGLFQPGVPFDYSTITPYTTREQMVYDADSGTIRNGFELPVKSIAVLHDGTYYVGGAAPPGGQVKLTAVDDAEVADLWKNNDSVVAEVGPLINLLGRQSLDSKELEAAQGLTRELMSFESQTTPTLYAAIYDGIPKSSDSGVEISDGQNLHIVIGRIAPGGAE